MVKWIICLFFYLLTNHVAQGQNFKVEGLVVDEEGNPLPGVNIIQKGDGNTLTDHKGRFTIHTYPNGRLVFHGFGYIPQDIKVEGRKNLIVKLILIANYLKECPADFNCQHFIKNTQLGFSSGIHYTPIGIRLRHYQPYFRGRKLFLNTILTFRSNLSENHYLHLALSKRLLSIKSSKIHLLAALKNVHIAPFQGHEYLFGSLLSFRGPSLSVGYVFQNFQDFETNSRQSGGFVGFYTPINKLISFRADIKYVSHLIQWESQLNFYWPLPNLSLFLNYEKFSSFQEIALGVNYSFSN
ncbi:MAG: carboxypeptidase-like regulatory domain-containing protein [Bacteroidota bacterium]